MIVHDQKPVKGAQKYNIPEDAKFDPQPRFISNIYFTLSRPQYKRSCGISSLVSIFNYHFSTIGTGKLNPLSVEYALQLLNVYENKQKYIVKQQKQVYVTSNQLVNSIDFGLFTGNPTLLLWYKLLCKHFEVSGRSYILYYPTSKAKGICKTAYAAYKQLILGLNEGKGYIYHCHDHYMCPIGYQIIKEFKDVQQELVQENKLQQEKVAEEQKETKSSCPQLGGLQEVVKQDLIPKFDVSTNIFIGQPSKMFSPFHVLSWQQMVHDMKVPFYNVRRKDRGIDVGRKRGLKLGGTNKCIMCFQKVQKRQKKK